MHARRRWNRIAASLLVLLPLGFAACAATDGYWLDRVPARERGRTNPLASEPQARRAGAKLFEENCAQCHGKTAEGRRGPSLRSAALEQRTAGELAWLLKNGSLGQGMPSWSRLPELQRWQLIAYLQSLPPKPGS